jgi:hypothetical protein
MPTDPVTGAAPLFALNGRARPTLTLIGGRLPVLIVDDAFRDPQHVRETALTLAYEPPDYPYPGRIAVPPTQDGSLEAFLKAVLDLVNQQYLPNIPPIAADSRRITRFSRVLSDFAITDVHPDALAETQRKPHTDPVPIFGLVYLNPEERGGTLFFDPPKGVPHGRDRHGYTARDDSVYPFVGKIEGRFNRLAVYPGFILHTAEIAGDWIKGDERRTSPRLTQRLVFFP